MKGSKLTLAYIGNYPPRQCGIGTFTQNLMRSIAEAGAGTDQVLHAEVIAMNNGRAHEYPQEVSRVIQEDTPVDYLQSAAYINQGADVCILQHEYGIFGGDHGRHILSLVEKLEVPLIVTLHTVLKTPSIPQKMIVRALADKAHRLVVMSRKAKLFLVEAYGIPAEKVMIIEHGVPNFPRGTRSELRRQFGFDQKKIVLTFGLLGPGKGIETMIQALPELVAEHPEVEYWVLGKTHPNIVKHEGERYRESLMQMAEELGVGDHLVMKNEFVDEERLFQYLVATDIYVTPYPNEAQITSGTLSYAVGAGTPVVSTPYWHAQELLAEGRGRYFEFKNPRQLAATLIELFHEEAELARMSERAAHYGDGLKWKKKGDEYLQLILEALSEEEILPPGPNRESPQLPELNFDHLLHMTDSTGILQHAKYSIPNFKEGYCLDDNARALLLGAMAQRQGYSQTASVVRAALAYMYYVQQEDGWFRNFVSYDRNFLDKTGSEDAFGRAIWALGYALAYPPAEVHRPLLEELYSKAFPHIDRLVSLRAMAYAVLGISSYLEAQPADEQHLEQLKRLRDRIVEQFRHNASTEWCWYESILAYGNGLLPLALIRSLAYLDCEETRAIAFDSMSFLSELTLAEGHLRPIGCNPFYRKGATLCYYDQQPIDAMAMVLLKRYAFQLTKNELYLRHADLCFQWFTGKNDLSLSLYQPENGGCYDGLMKDGVNLNQGAESTLAYLIARLAIDELYEENSKKETSQSLARSGVNRLRQVGERPRPRVRLFQKGQISYLKD